MGDAVFLEDRSRSVENRVGVDLTAGHEVHRSHVHVFGFRAKRPVKLW
ncbi:MAG: hypothetical protein V3W36_00630 [Acidimicrobiia bacterium]